MQSKMRHIAVLTSFIVILFVHKNYTQEIPKDTIYLEFKKNNGSFPHYRCKKFENKFGINFNLCKGEGLISPKNRDADTIANKYLINYSITKIETIDSLVKNWQERTKPLLINKYGIPYPNTTNKNNMFVTYIIEKFTSYFVKYRVYWRNQKP